MNIRLLFAAALSLGMVASAIGQPAPKWTPLFDGKTLSGWTATESGDWSVIEGGILVGKGRRSHLFSPNTYTNLELKTEVKLNHSGNSGIYIRAAKTESWPRGYEAQVENTSPDPQKTGSLYGFKRVTEQLIADDTWWTQHIIAIGKRIIIKVNDKIVVDFVDEKGTYRDGYLALQQHDDKSVVHYRNLQVKALPADEAAAWAEAKKSLPDSVR